MNVTMKTDGFRELERQLAEELPRATAKNVLSRTAVKAMERIREKMVQLAPREEGTLAESMKTQRVTARRMAGSVRFARSTGVEVMTGPAPAGKLDRSNASWQEDGTVKMAPNAYARPAADSEGRAVVEDVKDELTLQINKAKARIAKKLAKG